MKKETENKVNNNGTYTTVETIETKPEDGFVHEADINS